MLRIRPTLIAIGALLLLMGLALWRLEPDLDSRVFAALRLGPDTAWTASVIWLTRLGGIAVLGPVVLAAATWLAWRRRVGPALWLLLTIATGRLAVDAAKLLLARPRPELAERLTEVRSLSFPSAHSSGTMLTCLALALLWQRQRWATLPLAFVLVVAIGWSRIGLGVHWPSDVLAGWGLGMLWAGLALRWLKR